MKKLFLACLLTLAFCVSAPAQLAQTGAGKGSGAPPAGGCAEATAFLARTSGLSGGQVTAYTNFICGLAHTDNLITGNMGSTGCGSPFDIIKLFATNTTATAQLNLCGTSFSTLTNTGATFTAAGGGAGGYTGNGSTAFLDSGWNAFANIGTTNCGNGAVACNLALNSASHMAYDGTSRGTDAFLGTLGSGVTSTNSTLIIPYPTGGSGLTATQSIAGQAASLAVTNALGLTVGVRTGVNSEAIYHCDGSGCATASAGNTSANEPNVNMYYLAINTSGTAGNNTSDTVSAIAHGAQLNATQVAAFASRLNQFMIAVGAAHY